MQNRARFGIKIPNICAGLLAILHSAELGAEWPAQEGKHGGQPAGLPDRSRWSYPLPQTTTGKPRRMAEHSGGVPDPATMRFTPGPRAEAQKPVWHLLPGCRTPPATLPGGRRPRSFRRPPATFSQPFGLHHRLTQTLRRPLRPRKRRPCGTPGAPWSQRVSLAWPQREPTTRGADAAARAASPGCS